MVFATPNLEIIVPLKCYIFREYFQKYLLKILKNSNFMNFLVHFFSMLKLKNHCEIYENLF